MVVPNQNKRVMEIKKDYESTPHNPFEKITHFNKR